MDDLDFVQGGTRRINLPGGIALEGICIRVRRTGNGLSADGRLGVRGDDARALRANLSP